MSSYDDQRRHRNAVRRYRRRGYPPAVAGFFAAFDEFQEHGAEKIVAAADAKTRREWAERLPREAAFLEGLAQKLAHPGARGRG